MSWDTSHIVRFDQPFEVDPSVYNPRAILRDPPPSEETGEEPAFRLTGVLRHGQASLAGEAQEVQLRALEADFPLPEDQHAPAPPDEATIRAEVEAEWRALLEETVLHTREEAYEAGYATARDELQATYNAKLKILDEQMAQMKDALALHLTAVEQTAVHLSFDAASAVLEAPLTQHARQSCQRALAQAVEQLAGDGAIEIVLHPIDLLRVQEEGFDAQLGASFPGLRWTPDDSMTEGDWSARTSQAAVRRIRKEMLDLLAERLGAGNSEDE